LRKFTLKLDFDELKSEILKLAKSDEVKKELNSLKEKFRMLSSEITDRLASKSDLAKSDTLQKQYINQNFVTFEQSEKQVKKII
jgi:hypothetical protein